MREDEILPLEQHKWNWKGHAKLNKIEGERSHSNVVCRDAGKQGNL